MNRAVRDCLVTGFEPLIEGLKLPDEDDRHVLAAAVYACVQEIATSRRRPPQTFDKSGLTRSVTACAKDRGPWTRPPESRAGRNTRQALVREILDEGLIRTTNCLLLLALGLAGDLGDLRFRCSGAVGLCTWWSSLVLIGHCRATSDGPGTAQFSV
ncbi:hypothetical protein ACFT43_23710 [Streptomyces albidoflavus]